MVEKIIEWTTELTNYITTLPAEQMVWYCTLAGDRFI